MTNLYGVRKYKDKWDLLTKDDLRAFIGLRILAGAFKSSDEDLEDLWSEQLGRPIFSATMPKNQFKAIQQCLRFDNSDDRQARRERDKFAPIRSVYDKWNTLLPKMYNPGDVVTVDEMLWAFHGRCSFLQYLKSKPGRLGIKVWAACDSKTSYVWNTQPYLGKAPNTKPEINQGQRVLLDMVEGIKGRRIVADNLFSTHEGVIQLARQHCTYLGTVRKNKKFVPPVLLDMKKKPVGHSEFVFDNTNKISLCSYVPKRNRFVMMMSSAHMMRSVSNESHKKPLMILDYNKQKAGVDVADQMIANYTCQRKTKRWPCVVFDNMLNISALNGYIIYTSINPDWSPNLNKRRKNYLIELGHALVEPLIAQRSDRKLPRSESARKVVARVQSNTSSMSVDSDLSDIRTNSPRPHKRTRCGYCPPSNNATRYTTVCTSCEKHICPLHTSDILCKNCK